jgi:hypothetical protein
MTIHVFAHAGASDACSACAHEIREASGIGVLQSLRITSAGEANSGRLRAWKPFAANRRPSTSDGGCISTHTLGGSAQSLRLNLPRPWPSGPKLLNSHSAILAATWPSWSPLVTLTGRAVIPRERALHHLRNLHGHSGTITFPAARDRLGSGLQRF